MEQLGAAEAREAHNLDVPGSKPGVAILLPSVLLTRGRRAKMEARF